ncbi:uncharacterized protein L969DRAFT_14154 [Mixia osmundae IAM 14324]|uniref:Aquaporin n=1 Tax=Mixia osmundae (strain CBS 9802 / IAM 14324 / JCM 22182 / KY 12970) TaxID=764103 RepID=G7E3U1_MIXOS|nr:uncharacterized protein L969DRAFT_14154 [Mixia osmundae IAM 14324]KEI41946.1 hypothetical protein L969DRAFT_14154 [Mixia osmundae IAM 14324]GAA97501.1 hypothetical protein E5Q_04179 [Mixia osmundae IAM 14324]
MGWNSHLKQDLICFVGEFVGTTLFLFLGLGGIKTAVASTTAAQTQTITTLSNTEIQIISTSMGLSLLITAWIFYRITGGLFNPAVTFALYLVGAVAPFRSAILVIAQIAGGIAGSGLIALLTPGGTKAFVVTLEPGMNTGQGLMLEAFLTAILVFSVLMLAAEKHKATYLAPIGIGLTLFVCQLFGTLWTGCGMNPARALGPSVIQGSFVHYHWIYHVGPFIGSLIAVGFYMMLKAFDYGSIVLGQDADTNVGPAPVPVPARIWAYSTHGFSHSQRSALLRSGMQNDAIDQAEKGAVEAALAEHNLASAGSLTGEKSATDEKVANGHTYGPNGHLNGPSGQSENAAHQPHASNATPGNGNLIAGGPLHRNHHNEHVRVATPPHSTRASGEYHHARPSASTRTSSYNRAGNTGAAASSYPSMGSAAQDVGGIGAPASKATGLASLGSLGNVLGHTGPKSDQA